MISFQNVSKTFPDGTKAVDDISFTVDEGEFFVLIGPSGSGKTTALKMINRLIDPSEGDITVADENIFELDLKHLRFKIGYVLQQIALFPHMTIEENISIVPEMKKWAKQDIQKRVDELLTRVGLDPETYRGRLPKELSGGQQQRIGVVRALAGNPQILLMDEPFSALDPITREQLQQDIIHMQQEIKKTIVFVTHDMDEALALGSRICIMKDGAVVQIDRPDRLMQYPANDFVRSFIGDRRDPWSVSVSEVLETLQEDEVDERPAETNEAPINGETSLREALDVLESAESDALPVYRNATYQGVLSYKVITSYLKEDPMLDRRTGGTIL